MKTSVNMVRQMGNFNVTQRTKDSFFNATDLIKQWNSNSGKKKELKEFLKNKNTNEFINELEKDNRGNSTYLSLRGKNGGTWMNPILFIKFSMWLNVKFEIQVIKFVYDNLMAFRNHAGDNYVGLTNAVQRFNSIDYSKLAKALNYIVFDDHEKGIRQTASESQLKELTELQKKLQFAIEMNYIKTFDELLNEMRKIWYIKFKCKLNK